MKLEKREITLNEADTLEEACFMEEALLHAYVDVLRCQTQKQTRTALLNHIREIAEDVYQLADLLSDSKNSVGMKS